MDPAQLRLAALAVAVASLPQASTAQTRIPPLPEAVTNNAVAWAPVDGGPVVLYSFLGLGPARSWSALSQAALSWSEGDSAWRRLPPVPGPGRLAATAQAAGGRIYLFGGYTVAEDGTEASLPNVDIWDPALERWTSGAPIPVPVDDAVSGVWRDSLIYLISGWHDNGNVADVQIYDPAGDRWLPATPIPGPPVFGHAGGIAGNTIVYVDGTVRSTRPRYRIEASSWLGEIDSARPTRVRWRRIENHPGPPRYRAAAVGWGNRVWFVGGTDNPYNYDGIGYDGRPAEPLPGAFAYDAQEGRWNHYPDAGSGTMDHRGLIPYRGALWVLGGMAAGQSVTAAVRGLPIPDSSAK